MQELKEMGVEAQYSSKEELATKMAEVRALREVDTLLQAARTDSKVQALWC